MCYIMVPPPCLVHFLLYTHSSSYFEQLCVDVVMREVCLCYSMELRRKLEEERQVKERNLKLMEELERLADENVCINLKCEVVL